MDKFTEYFLVHINVADYISFFLCWAASIAYDWFMAHHYHPGTFNAKVLLFEQWRKWVASIICGFAMLYMLPEGVHEIFDIHWNTLFSGAIGLAPLLVFRKVLKTTKSKIRQGIEDSEKKEFGL